MLPQFGLVAHLIRFCRSLRERGLLLGPSETAEAVRSLDLVDIMDKDQVYWALRTVLVSRMDEIDAYDECFHRFWPWQGPQYAPPRHPPVQVGGLRQAARRALGMPGETEATDDNPPLAEITRGGASPVEVESRKDLTELPGRELAEVSKIAARIIRALPSVRGRRRRRHRRKGSPDLRGALRLNLPQGGDLIELPRRQRIPKVPRLLVLLDVSGSMDRHTELLLQLAYSLGQRTGWLETFVFSTSLTRVTRDLKCPSFSEALRRVGGSAHHWSGGTRIGECLSTLYSTYRHLLGRSTSVFLLSDGWDTGDPDRLARELARIRRRVSKLVWLNPLLGTPGYEPLTQGLQAARPYVDTFASALGLAQLRRLPSLLRGCRVVQASPHQGR